MQEDKKVTDLEWLKFILSQPMSIKVTIIQHPDTIHAHTICTPEHTRDHCIAYINAAGCYITPKVEPNDISDA